ncbi:MAG: hypothetical protein ACR2RB_14495 [Gammaproteobacteria bacterium]
MEGNFNGSLDPIELTSDEATGHAAGLIEQIVNGVGFGAQIEMSFEDIPIQKR